MKRSTFPWLALTGLLAACGDDRSASTGTSASEAGNALAVVRLPGGAPAARARVEIWPDSALPDTTGVRAPAWSGTTDAAGIVRPRLGAGTWSLVARDGATSFRARIAAGWNLSDTLRSDARMEGVVAGARWILLPGLGRTVLCGADGRFAIDSLPSGYTPVGILHDTGLVRARAWIVPGTTTPLVPAPENGWLTPPPSDTAIVDLSTRTGTFQGLVGGWTVPGSSPLWSLGAFPYLVVLDSTGASLGPALVDTWNPATRSGHLSFVLPSDLPGGARHRYLVVPTDSFLPWPSVPRVLPLPAAVGPDLLPASGAFQFALSLDLPASGSPSSVFNWLNLGPVLDTGLILEWHPEDSTLQVDVQPSFLDPMPVRVLPGRQVVVVTWLSTMIQIRASSGANHISANPPAMNRAAWELPVIGGGALRTASLLPLDTAATAAWIQTILQAWK